AEKVYYDSNEDFNHTESTDLRAWSETFYDQRGRVYKTLQHEIDSAAAQGHTLVTALTWYDPCGRLIKTADANGLFHKTAYDGAGRATGAYLSFDTDDTEGGSAYAGGGTVDGDTVIEEALTSDNTAGYPSL